MRIVRALMGETVDYAGLFPPAKLDMPATTINYDRYRRGPDKWLLGRLIVPVARLDEFESCAKSLLPRKADDAWTLSALCSPVADNRFEGDLERIDRFNEEHFDPRQSASNGSAIIDTIEIPASNGAQIDYLLDTIPDHLFPYIEVPAGEDPRGLIAACSGSDAGAKVRTGGANAGAYPTPDNLARFILACVASEVPFKATAGLHHPLRHQSDAVGTKEFGFLNLLIGACFAAEDLVDQKALAELLCEEDATAFRFTETSIGWRRIEVDLRRIMNARKVSAHSFGSCSFDEPLDGLRALGLLEAPITA
jgi:hypothetical protein